MQVIPVNFLAVLASAIASMVTGMLWYSSWMFAKPWMKLMGFTKKSMAKAKNKGMGKIFSAAFVGSLVMSYVLAHFVFFMNAKTLVDALQLSFWTWLGFIAPVMLGSVLWEGKSMKLYAINVSHQLVSLAFMAIILTLWH